MYSDLINKIASLSIENGFTTNHHLTKKMFTKKFEKATTPELALEHISPIIQDTFGKTMMADLWDEDWAEDLELWFDTTTFEKKMKKYLKMLGSIPSIKKLLLNLSRKN